MTQRLPARLTDASGPAPAYIEVGQFDIFRDEGIRYALNLSHAGVPVELHGQVVSYSTSPGMVQPCGGG